MSFDNLEEFFNKIATRTSNEAISKAAAEAQTAANTTTIQSANTIVEQVASFIDELKDFIDDRLVDTTCQLELSNQRIGDLHMSLNFLIGEITYLKYQNQELKNDMHSFLQNLKRETESSVSSKVTPAVNSQCCSKCSKSKAKKNKSTDTSSSVSNSTTNTNASTSSTDLKINNNNSNIIQNRASKLQRFQSNNNNKNNVTSIDGSATGQNRLRKTLIESNGVLRTTSVCINTCGDENYGSTILCSVVNDDDTDTVNHKKYISPPTANLERYFKEKNAANASTNGAGSHRKVESFGDNSFDAQFKLDWPTINSQQKAAAQSGNTNAGDVNSKLEADILFIKTLINNHQKNGKMVAYVSTELSDSSSGRSSSNKSSNAGQIKKVSSEKMSQNQSQNKGLDGEEEYEDDYEEEEDEDEVLEEDGKSNYDRAARNCTDLSSSIIKSNPSMVKKYSNSRANSS
jgi:hypothetical protein